MSSLFTSSRLPPSLLCLPRLETMVGWKRQLKDDSSTLNENFASFLPFLMLCQSTNSFQTSPPIFHVGSSADQRKFYGNDWAKKILVSKTTPDRDLERSAAHGYGVADDIGQCFDLCETQITTPIGIKYIVYARLLAPLTTKHGLKIMSAFTVTLNSCLQ